MAKEFQHHGCPRCGGEMLLNSGMLVCQCGYRLSVEQEDGFHYSSIEQHIADALEVRYAHWRGARIEIGENSIPIYDRSQVLAALAKFPMFRFTSEKERREVAERIAARAAELSIGMEEILDDPRTGIPRPSQEKFWEQYGGLLTNAKLKGWLEAAEAEAEQKKPDTVLARLEGKRKIRLAK